MNNRNIKKYLKALILLLLLFFLFNIFVISVKTYKCEFITFFDDPSNKKQDFFFQKVIPGRYGLWGWNDIDTLYLYPDSSFIILPKLDLENYSYLLHAKEIKRLWFIPLFNMIGKRVHYTVAEENIDSKYGIYLYRRKQIPMTIVGWGGPNLFNKIALLFYEIRNNPYDWNIP